MAKKTTTLTVKKAKRGQDKRMTSGSGWKLVSANGTRFTGTLIKTINLDNWRIAIFNVPK